MSTLAADELVPHVASSDTTDVDSTFECDIDALHLCETGQVSILDQLFSASGISIPAPPITLLNFSSHTLPCTYQMVEAAVLGSQCATVARLYTYFPSACIYGPELVAAIEVGDVEIFKLLAAQSKSRLDVIDNEFVDRETSLIKACKGKKKGIALYLLEEGADPNYKGVSGDLSSRNGALANAIVEQDLEVVQKLVEAGAVIEDFHVDSAVKRGRVEVARYLTDKSRVKVDLNDSLMSLRRTKVVSEKEEKRLLATMVPRWRDWRGKSARKHERSGMRMERMIERLQLAKAQGIGL